MPVQVEVSLVRLALGFQQRGWLLQEGHAQLVRAGGHRESLLEMLVDLRMPLAAAWHSQLVAEGWPARQAADRASHLMRTVMGYCSTEAGARQVTRDALEDVVAHLEGSARSQAEEYLANVDVPGFPGLFDLSVNAAIDALMAAAEARAAR